MIQSIKASVLASIVDKYLESIALRGNALCEVYCIGNVSAKDCVLTYIHHLFTFLANFYSMSTTQNVEFIIGKSLVLRFGDLKALDKME